MIRAGLVVLLVAAVAVAILALTGDPGRASVIWLGWRADMTAARRGADRAVLGALVATLVWRTLLWILAAPQRAARDARREPPPSGQRGADPRLPGRRGRRRLRGPPPGRRRPPTSPRRRPAWCGCWPPRPPRPPATLAAAQAAYTAMLGFPEMRLAGHKGLMQLALAQGERETGAAPRPGGLRRDPQRPLGLARPAGGPAGGRRMARRRWSW